MGCVGCSATCQMHRRRMRRCHVMVTANTGRRNASIVNGVSTSISNHNTVGAVSFPSGALPRGVAGRRGTGDGGNDYLGRADVVVVRAHGRQSQRAAVHAAFRSLPPLQLLRELVERAATSASGEGEVRGGGCILSVAAANRLQNSAVRDVQMVCAPDGLDESQQLLLLLVHVVVLRVDERHARGRQRRLHARGGAVGGVGG